MPDRHRKVDEPGLSEGRPVLLRTPFPARASAAPGVYAKGGLVCTWSPGSTEQGPEPGTPGVV